MIAAAEPASVDSPVPSIAPLSRIQLEIFEGPLDLLLHLIQKNELSITEVSLSAITAQYLDYLELFDELNIEIASEFLVMATELARLKSRALLPPMDEETPEEEDDFLSESDLVGRLLAYQQFKRVAEMLASRHQLDVDVFARAVCRDDLKLADDEPMPIRPEKSDKLVYLYKAMMARGGREIIHQVIGEKVSVRQKMVELLDYFHAMSALQRASLSELIKTAPTRSQKIGVFLAVLELIRMKVLRLASANTPDWALCRSDVREEEGVIDSYEEDFRS